MNLVQLRAFDAVARTGSITEAARRLFVTQPAVTSNIKTLEATYDVALLRRRGRGVEPTELGRSLAAISRELFALEDRASELLRAHERLTEGTLQIAADGPYIAVPLVAEFRRRFPGVRVSVEIASTARAQERLAAERCEISIQGSIVEDDALHVVDLSEFDIIAFVNRDHPWALDRRKTVPFVEIDRHPVIAREAGSTMRRRFDAACAEADIEPEYFIETTSRETVKEAVAAGLGIGLISEAELRPDPRLWPVRLSGTDLRYTERVVCLRRRRTLAVIREFLRIAEATRARERALPKRAAPAAPSAEP